MSENNNDRNIILTNGIKPSKETQSLVKRSQALSKADNSKMKREIRIFTGHNGSVNCCAYADGFFLSGGEDSNILSWDYDTGQLLRVFKGHQAAVTRIAVFPNQKNFVSSDKKGVIYYWQYESGDFIEIFNSKIYHPYRWQIPVVDLSISPYGNVFFVGQEPLTIFMWVATQNQIYHLSGKLGGLLSRGENTRNYIGLYGGSAVATSSDGKFVAAASDKTIFLWDLETCEVHYYFGGPPHKFFASPTSTYTEDLDHPVCGALRKSADKALEDMGFRHSGAITSLKFLPGIMKFVSSSEDKTIRIWDFSNHEKIADPPQIIRGHNGCVRSIAVSKDGNYIISGSDDTKIKVHNAITGCLKEIYEGHKAGVLNVDVSPEGDRIASCGQDGTIRLWDFA